MSQSLAAAKKRRAHFQEPPPAPTTSSNGRSLSAPAGLTLPQVIQLVDKRLITLENFMNQSTNQGQPAGSSSQDQLPEIVDEFDKRYNMLAEEIVNIKNIVLSLQSYTMEVNKSLLDERVRILSDIEEERKF